MLKVTLLSGAIFLNFLLFNGCNGTTGSNREEIRYENKLDSLYERKIDSAYARIGRDCDSTLAARWQILSDSIYKKHHILDSVATDSLVRDKHLQDSLALEKHVRDSLAAAAKVRVHPRHRH